MRSLRLIHYLLPLVLLCAGACNKTGFKKIEPVVRDNIVLFAGGEIPAELDYLVESNRVILFGETRYVQEHHEYIAQLLDRYGPEGLCFFNEFSVAYNWMIEDYVQGKIEHLPYNIRLLNHLWLEKIREINLSQVDTMPLHFFFSDVNHERDDFKNSVLESEKILGHQDLFNLIKILKVDVNAYRDELYKLRALLEEQRVTYVERWGETWYERYTFLIDHEIESHYTGFRRTNH